MGGFGGLDGPRRFNMSLLSSSHCWPNKFEIPAMRINCMYSEGEEDRYIIEGGSGDANLSLVGRARRERAGVKMAIAASLYVVYFGWGLLFIYKYIYIYIYICVDCFLDTDNIQEAEPVHTTNPMHQHEKQRKRNTSPKQQLQSEFANAPGPHLPTPFPSARVCL